jgi:acyl-CoA thioester hydrolase
MRIPPAKIQVRLVDLDVLGHVNNTYYLTYFEMARIHYFKALLGGDWDWQSFGMVLVRNEIDYHKSVLLHHEPEIVMFTESVGNKSFTLGYELTVEGEVFATGRSVQVAYNALKQQTIELPEEMKNVLLSLIR